MLMSFNPHRYAKIGWIAAGPAMNKKSTVESENNLKKRPGIPLDLVRRSRQGDSRAMELLYEHFKPSFFGVAYRYTYNRAVSEDILQDIFIKIFTHIHELDSDEAFMGWAYRIAVNTSLSYLRRHKVAARKMVPFDSVEGTARQRGDLDHEEMFDRTLDEALRDLSTKLKSVFILHDIQGFKHEEIGQILGCSTGTSKSQLFKARLKIRQRLMRNQRV